MCGQTAMVPLVLRRHDDGSDSAMESEPSRERDRHPPHTRSGRALRSEGPQPRSRPLVWLTARSKRAPASSQLTMFHQALT
ncbi:Uncharacterised protein [Mycobacteroides abscessus subsp. abscessus]|nr:Uncharacterised protein [Mycobacteroides abscessus subsp. abscessus]